MIQFEIIMLVNLNISVHVMVYCAITSVQGKTNKQHVLDVITVFCAAVCNYAQLLIWLLELIIIICVKL